MQGFRNAHNHYNQSGRLSNIQVIPATYNEYGFEDHTWPWVDNNRKYFCLDLLDEQGLPSPVSPLTPSSTTGSSVVSDGSSLPGSRSISISPSPSPASSPKGSSRHSRRRDPNYIPRPRNAFIIFRSDFIQGLAQGQTELSRDAAKVWHEMSVQDKQVYAERAALEKEEHVKKYPHYIYAPVRKNPTNNKRKPAAQEGCSGQGKKPKCASLRDHYSSQSALPPLPRGTPTVDSSAGLSNPHSLLHSHCLQPNAPYAFESVYPRMTSSELPTPPPSFSAAAPSSVSSFSHSSSSSSSFAFASLPEANKNVTFDNDNDNDMSFDFENTYRWHPELDPYSNEFFPDLGHFSSPSPSFLPEHGTSSAGVDMDQLFHLEANRFY